MNAPVQTAEARELALAGMGASRLRKEDARFIQGKGNYVDDIKMPGMLHMDIVRSPYAHARIKSIDKSEALKVPGVIAVLTAEDLKPLKLHWMPTLAGDVAAVLADGKVHFQMQEVAVVIAEDRYSAADGVEAVMVEYEELPVVIDPYEALKPDAPVIRDDLAGKTEGAHGKRDHHNHIFTWDAGDKSAADAAFDKAEVTVSQHMYYPRVHPCPLETCGCVASFDPIKGDLTTFITSQAPHVVRTVVSMLSGIPESKVRIVSPDIGGGFGNKVGIYPGYVCAIVASIVLGRPVKWVEDRIENISSTAFARDYHMDGEIAATADGKITGLRVNVVADHGAFDACADPTKFPAGLFHICSGSYDIPAAHAFADTPSLLQSARALVLAGETTPEEAAQHRKITEAVHAADPDVKIVMQILHTGALARTPDCVAPSPVKSRIGSHTPNCDSSTIWPPCRSTMRFTIASPRPEPVADGSRLKG